MVPGGVSISSNVQGCKHDVDIYPAPIGGQEGQIQAGKVLCMELVQKIGKFIWEISEHLVEAEEHLACAYHILPHKCPPSIIILASSPSFCLISQHQRDRAQMLQTQLIILVQHLRGGTPHQWSVQKDMYSKTGTIQYKYYAGLGSWAHHYNHKLAGLTPAVVQVTAAPCTLWTDGLWADPCIWRTCCPMINTIYYIFYYL